LRAMSSGISSWAHEVTISPSKVCSLTLINNWSKYFFWPFFIPIAISCTPPQMIANGSYSWPKIFKQEFRINKIIMLLKKNQIRSLLSKQFIDIDHQFDVWHLAKSIEKNCN
jgi:hypothetical protein